MCVLCKIEPINAIYKTRDDQCHWSHCLLILVQRTQRWEWEPRGLLPAHPGHDSPPEREPRNEINAKSPIFLSLTIAIYTKKGSTRRIRGTKLARIDPRVLYTLG